MSEPERQPLDPERGHLRDDHVPEAITTEEIAGTAEPAGEKRANNAFTELMAASRKRKSTADSPPAHHVRRNKDFRDGLGVYIEHPEGNPQVVEYDDDFVVIRDLYPKASVHLLLLPRDPAIYRQHPLHALSENPALLEEVKKRAERLKALAGRELRRLYGQDSLSDQPYQTALVKLMNSDDPPGPNSEDLDKQLPPGRDWANEIVAGVHTHPSMNHMHVHIISREMHSPCLKSARHYLSFNTSFLVTLNEFPLEAGSPRFHPGDWPSWELRCWRCKRSFGRQFKRLKEHLEEEEWPAWKRE